MMKPILVGGTGRCGTTLIRRCLSRHPQVSTLPGELRLLTDPGGLLDLVHAMSTDWGLYRGDKAVREFQEMAQDMTEGSGSGRRYYAQEFDVWIGESLYRELLDKLLNTFVRYETSGRWTGMDEERETFLETSPVPFHEAADAAQEFLQGLYKGNAPRATHWVDDSPQNIYHYPDTQRLLGGQALQIHMVRHPLDVLASYKKIRDSKSWTSESVEQNCIRIRDTLERWQKTFRTTDHTLTLKLEDVIEAPESAFKTILSRAEISWDKRVVEPVDPDAAHQGEYRNRGLMDEDLSYARQHLTDVCKEYGYEIP